MPACTIATSKSLGVALLDYDNDGWLDLFVTNDTQPNKLYRNNHDGTFTDVGVPAGVAYSDAGTARAGMGTDAGDYDNSGRPSLLIGNFTNEGMALYRNDGSGLSPTRLHFRTRPHGRSIRSPSAHCSSTTISMDCLDILAVNGHVADDISMAQPTIQVRRAGAAVSQRWKQQVRRDYPPKSALLCRSRS